jgi:integrase
MPRHGDGLVLRGRTWWLDFHHRGERYQVRLGRNISRTTAAELATVERAKTLKGEAGIGRKRRDILFDDAQEEFLKWAEASKKLRTFKNYRWLTSQLMKSFQGMNLSQIHPFLVEKHKQTRIAEGARIAANRELTCLKSIFNRCIEWRRFEGENPAKTVKLTREPKGRLRFLNLDEEKNLLNAAGEPLRTIILTGIYAGLRIQGEALKLKWQDVDLQHGILTVQAAYAKNGETRTIPLNRLLWEALERLSKGRQSPCEFVFVSSKREPFRSIRTAFTTACQHANLAAVSPHILRHTFASRLAMAGVDIRTLQELGGWKEIKMVERYAHLSTQHKAEAIGKMAHPTSEDSPTVFTTPKKQSA